MFGRISPPGLKWYVIVSSVTVVLLATTLVYSLLYEGQLMGYLCIASLVMLLGLGFMGFIDAGVYVYPRGADVLQYRKIVAYNPIIPFFVVGASLLLYFKIGKLVIYTLLSAFGHFIAFVGFIAYTIGYFLLVIFTLLFTTLSVCVEFLPDNTAEITYGGKKYKSKIDEIRLITGDELSAFGFRVKDNMLLIVTERWQVKVSVFFTRKAYMKFYSYLYYRLHPEEYLKSKG